MMFLFFAIAVVFSAPLFWRGFRNKQGIKKVKLEDHFVDFDPRLDGVLPPGT